MSDLLNSASLVMIPSGYKEDVVYSQIPTDGSGDLSFTRASNGTRVNSAGLVEVVPWNLIQYSEDFTNGVWVPAGATQPTITANTTTAPNGTLTADTIAFASPNSSRLFQSYSGISATYTLSLYAKSSSAKKFRFKYYDGTSDTFSSDFTTTNEWQRFTYTFDSQIVNFSIDNESVGGAGSMFIWGAQLNIGSTAKPYFPTTDRLNVPRLTYQNGGGGCPSLLLEKQSTNLCLQSRNFQTTWTNGNVTITANSTTDVYGTTQAQKIEATGSGIHRCAQFLSTTSGSVYALSIDAKKGSTDWVMIRHDNGGSLNYFNLNTGTKGATCDASALIENVGNGWYRLTVFHTTSSSSGPELYVAKGNNDHDFTANGEYIYIDNVQYEQSSYPTSRIITTSSSATRVADACYKTGISSLIGQTEGTIFADITPQIFNDSAYQTVAIIYPSAGLGGTYFHFYKNTGSKTLFFAVLNAVVQCSLSYTMTNNTRYKVAAGYKNNDFVLYVNGVQVGSDTSGTIASVTYSTLEMGYDSFNTDSQMSLNEFVLFPTRLTNAELASLTTL